MKSVNREILEQVIAASVEPVMIVRLDHTDWPVVLANPAFESIGGGDALQQPFADVVEALVGREIALEISNSLRSRQESSFAVEVGSREFLLGRSRRQGLSTCFRIRRTLNLSLYLVNRII